MKEHRAAVAYDPSRRNPWIVRRMSNIGEYEYWMGRPWGMGFLADPEFPARIMGFKTREAALRRAKNVNAARRSLRLAKLI